MHEHRPGAEPISDRAAGATAGQIVIAPAFGFGFLDHRRGS
jgi:hypothetical protein